LDSELFSVEEKVPCASISEKCVIESTTIELLEELRGIGRYVDVRITNEKFKYNLLKTRWLPSSNNYNFPVV